MAAAGVLSSVISVSAASITPILAQCATNAPTTVSFAPLISVTCGSANRRLAANVNSGAGDGDLYSLGLAADGGTVGGAAIFEFGSTFSGLMTVVEVTNPSNHFEAANVFVSNSLDFSGVVFAGLLDNGLAPGATEVTTLDIAAGPWTYLWFQDVSREFYANTGSTDGFDIDSITVKISAVPLPAGIVLLGSAFFGVGAWRRRGPV